MPKSKATLVTRQKRLDYIIDLLGRGKMRYQIINICCEEWGLKETGVQNYLDDAYVILKNGFSDEDLIAGYKKIYEKTLEDTPSVAIKAYDSIAKLKKGGFSNEKEIFKVIIPDEPDKETD